MQKSVPARQIALFSACVLPVYKMVELPSLLARRVDGDIWLPALIQFALQFLLLLALLWTVKKEEDTLAVRLENKLGKAVGVVYGLYAVFFLLFAVLPVLDLEKFTYAVFYDTAPTSFSFGFFFLLSAYIGCRGISCVGRFGDGALFLVPLAFFALLVMSFPACDFSALLPIAKTPPVQIFDAVRYTAMPFTDVAVQLPTRLPRTNSAVSPAENTGFSVSLPPCEELSVCSAAVGMESCASCWGLVCTIGRNPDALSPK